LPPVNQEAHKQREAHPIGIVVDRHHGSPPGENEIAARLPAEGLAR
jgi:hypothetical protein